MNYKEIKELIRIIDASTLSEFHIEQGDIKLSIKKEVLVKHINSSIKSDYDHNSSEANVEIVPTSPAAEKMEEENLHIIKSPIVGVFYLSPSPELPPFVKNADKVKSGQVLCIVEAMKLMNEITSDVDGEIVEVLMQNQSPVEFGQPLFKIRKV